MLLVGRSIAAQTPRELDSASVWAIYSSNPGNTLGWDNTQPYNTWEGVSVFNNSGRVWELILNGKNISSIPEAIGFGAVRE